MSITPRLRWPAGTALGALALTGMLAACSGHENNPGNRTGPTPPAVTDAQIASDVASAAAGQIASDIADYSSADTGGGGGLMFTPAPSATAARAGSRTFRTRTSCTPNNSTFQLAFAAGSDTLNIDLTWVYFAPGQCQSTFSSSTTDSIAYTSVDSLHINGLAWVDHVIRDRAYSVSGSGGSSLSSDTVHIWSGVGQGTDTSAYTGSSTPRTYTGGASDTAVAITFSHPRNGDVFPETGTVSLWYAWTLTVIGADAESVTVSRHVVATLNGTNDVPLQVFDASTGALALTCTLDLTAHLIVPGSCQ
jgi:hypothetical protein